MKKLNCILLIDDNEADNFFHELVIREFDCVNHVISSESGQVALELLGTEGSNSIIIPDIIFLDINMPGMNGWEFLDQYRKIPKDLTKDIRLIMLTTSINPDDKEKAKLYPEISEFLSKPLSEEKLSFILQSVSNEVNKM